MDKIKPKVLTGNIHTNLGLNVYDSYKETLYYFSNVYIYDFDVLADILVKEVPSTIYYELRFHVVRVTIETMIVGLLNQSIDVLEDLETEYDKLGLTVEEQLHMFNVVGEKDTQIWQDALSILHTANPVDVFTGWINANDDVGYQIVIYGNNNYIEPDYAHH